MNRSMLVVCLALALALLGPLAHARKSAAPIGVYHVIATNTCHSNQVGFSPEPYLYQLAPSGQVLATWEATMEFFADGRVTEVSTGQYSLPGAGQPVGIYQSTCQYTSTPNPDESLALEGECHTQILSGIATGEINHNSPALWRVISAPGTILLSSIGTRVNILATNTGLTHYRICQGHGFGTK